MLGAVASTIAMVFGLLYGCILCGVSAYIAGIVLMLG
jgi:hypothetical protein